MTSCDYCERKEPEYIVWWCEECSARCCSRHSARAGAVLVCDPPRDGPWQQRGCYKPPVAEVADDSR